MATVLDIIERAYTKVNGEYEVVVEGSDDFNTYLNVLNQMVESWVQTPYVKWQSLFDMDYKVGNVTNGNLSYDVDDFELIMIGNSPFDNVFFIDSKNVVVSKYKILDQAAFQSSDAENIAAFLAGTLYLKSTPDKIVGTTINLPVYVLPVLYTSASQEVLIDSVPWLIASIAAFICDASPVPFIARNADKFAKQAGIFMKSMRANNRHSQQLVIKRAGEYTGNQGHSFSDFINSVIM